MSKLMKKLMTVCLVLICSASFALAGDKARDRDRQKDKKQDGSCKSFLMEQDSAPPFILAADKAKKQDRKRDRKKDGSCNS